MAKLVTIDFQDLINHDVDLSEKIFEAYGPHGLGALTISGIPDFLKMRDQLLPVSHKLAHLPDDAKAKLEHEPSMYNVGWSHGKEKFGDKPDFAKGSFYANPVYDVAADDDNIAKHPFFYPKNIWPNDDLPELEPAFKQLGGVMFDAVQHLSQHIDRLIKSKVPTYKNVLSGAMATTKKIKGRLLYYYPTDAASEDGWIGWHNDSGFLTALTSDIFFNDTTGEIVENPDPNGGLWIVTRDGGSVRVRIPEDHLAVQCGECLQIISGGLLVATPHAVKASKSPEGMRIARSSFPVFVDTDFAFPLSAPEGITRDQVFNRTIESRVPPLESRWVEDGVPFVEFLGATFRQYYEWNKKQ